MTNEFKKEMLEDISKSTTLCYRYAELAKKEEKDENILSDLDYLKLFAKTLIHKIDLYKESLNEDNQLNEKQEDVIS